MVETIDRFATPGQENEGYFVEPDFAPAPFILPHLEPRMALVLVEPDFTHAGRVLIAASGLLPFRVDKVAGCGCYGRAEALPP